MIYEIKRGSAVIAQVRASGTQSREVMGKDVVNMTFSLPNHIDFLIGDTVEVFNADYVLNKKPVVNKLSSIRYDYTLQFESKGYDLIKVQYLFYDNSQSLTISDFPLTRTPTDS